MQTNRRAAIRARPLDARDGGRRAAVGIVDDDAGRRKQAPPAGDPQSPRGRAAAGAEESPFEARGRARGFRAKTFRDDLCGAARTAFPDASSKFWPELRIRRPAQARAPSSSAGRASATSRTRSERKSSVPDFSTYFKRTAFLMPTPQNSAEKRSSSLSSVSSPEGTRSSRATRTRPATPPRSTGRWRLSRRRSSLSGDRSRPGAVAKRRGAFKDARA